MTVAERTAALIAAGRSIRRAVARTGTAGLARLRDARPTGSVSVAARELDDPRFVFNPTLDRWTVEHRGQAYEPVTADDLDSLLTLLPVEIDDRPADGRVGTVRVADHPTDPSLRFASARGEKLTTTLARTVGGRTPRHRWVEGAHDDGWIDTFARLRVDRPGLVSIEAYLPADGGPPKDVAVQLGLGHRVRIEVFRLERGRTTSLHLRIDDHDAEPVLTFRTSRPESVDDDRLLGFVVAGIAVSR